MTREIRTGWTQVTEVLPRPALSAGRAGYRRMHKPMARAQDGFGAVRHACTENCRSRKSSSQERLD